MWDSPGFPSIAVPYDKTRDFFYSGHTSVLSIVFFELRTVRLYKISYICLFCLVYTIILLSTSQVHYVIDIVGGLIFSNYLYEITVSFLQQIDWLFSQPIVFGFWVYYKIKNGNQKD